MISIEIKEAKKLNCEESAFFSFPYDNEVVGVMRAQSSRYFHADAKVWEVPAVKLGLILNQIHDKEITITGLYKPVVPKEEINLPDFNFKTNPYSYQLDGFKYALNNDNFFLGDEQGLGKTKQVIDNAVARKQLYGYKHCLIICCVNGLKWNWQNEIRIHSNENSWILGSKFRKSGKQYIGSNDDKLDDLKHLPKDRYFIITNIETLRGLSYTEGSGKKKKSIYPIADKIKELCDKGEIDMIAVDEMHKCKNPDAAQTEALLKLTAPCKIAMTGTPITNTALDSFPILKFLGEEKHSFYEFKRHYCVFGGYGNKEIVGYKNMPELKERIDKVMLRRLKKDVLDLPEKIRTTEYVEMSPKQEKVYDEVVKAVRRDMAEMVDKVELSEQTLAMITRLRQATGYTGILSSEVHESAKLDRMEELVEEAVANGDKVLIFSNWTEMTDPALKRLAKYNPASITGKIKDADKKEQERKFMTDPTCKVIVGTTGAMGTGYTLTAGATVIFLDSPWTKAAKDQAEDRAHRIGTKSNVSIITLVCKDTIDEYIEEIVEGKGELSDALVDGKITPSTMKLFQNMLRAI